MSNDVKFFIFLFCFICQAENWLKFTKTGSWPFIIRKWTLNYDSLLFIMTQYDVINLKNIKWLHLTDCFSCELGHVISMSVHDWTWMIHNFWKSKCHYSSYIRVELDLWINYSLTNMTHTVWVIPYELWLIFTKNIFGRQCHSWNLTTFQYNQFFTQHITEFTLVIA